MTNEFVIQNKEDYLSNNICDKKTNIKRGICLLRLIQYGIFKEGRDNKCEGIIDEMHGDGYP